jgi:hypothetical protein
VVPAPQAPAERFAAILFWLAQAVGARSGAGLPFPLIGLIVGRLSRIKQAFARVAALVAAGSYCPRRRVAAPRPGQKPPPPDRLPRQFGWLLPLLPDAVAYRSQLEQLLADPEMAALLAAAPASLRRPIRSLCWMLRISPPPVLAAPAKPRTPRETKPPATPEPAETPPPRPQPPPWLRGLRRSLPRIRGAPHPA